MAVLVAMISTVIFILTFAVILAKSNFKELWIENRRRSMMWWFVRSMSILRMVGIMLVAMQANKSAKFIIQQQADTDDNADSDDNFYDDVIAQSALNWMEKRLTAAVKNICVVKSNTWWYTIRNRRCILWQQKLQM